jgi:mono/diheme cytochrome c family protein
MSRRSVVRSLIVLGGILVVLQFVPYGCDRTNPPVVQEPAWDSPRTRELFFRACVDCHSNETAWPWYSRVAPVSWLVVSDVDEGREHLNVSEWHREQRHADEAAEMVRDGEMPLWFYVPLHPRARLAPAERDELIRGLVATFGDEP